jgi:ATP-dependent Clp protease ATP-binding subunit ClpA
MARVVDKFLLQLEHQLEEQNVEIGTSDAARAWLGEKGYDRLYGARPLARIIQEHIKKPLAEELLFGQLADGGLVNLDTKDGKLAFAFEPPKKATRAKKPKRDAGGESSGGEDSGGEPKVPVLVE